MSTVFNFGASRRDMERDNNYVWVGALATPDGLARPDHRPEPQVCSHGRPTKDRPGTGLRRLSRSIS